jgi:hypothetical protein
VAILPSAFSSLLTNTAAVVSGVGILAMSVSSAAPPCGLLAPPPPSGARWCCPPPSLASLSPGLSLIPLPPLRRRPLPPLPPVFLWSRCLVGLLPPPAYC